ncbi:MAG: response regulator, partial [Pararhizobium sp.]
MTSQILVIDDDPVQRRLLTNMIERLGHIAHLADNGRSGLELLERKRGLISVILLDLMMPEMNGHGFLEAIAERGIDTPVIVQTGQGGIETVVLAMQAGAFDFVVKPVSPERLNVAITNA